MSQTKTFDQVIFKRGIRLKNGVRLFDGAGFPKSGTSGTGAGTGLTPVGSIYYDKTNKVTFVNENTSASPYWTPVSFDQRGLMGWYSDFRDGIGKADANTDATTTLAGSGIRIHGQGIAETDSGFVITMSDQGAIGDLHTTDEAAHLAVLSVGSGTTPVFKPSVNGTIVMDANVAMLTDILTRSLFFGFCGSAANATDPIVTGSGTTITFTTTFGDDVAALIFDSALTDADRLFAPHDKANTNANILTTATGVDTGVDFPAAGTYKRLRVEVDSDGAVRMFAAKAQIASFAAATLTTTTAIHPICGVRSTDAAIKSMLVKHFGAWGVRA